jgi:two-component system response regulator RpfG
MYGARRCARDIPGVYNKFKELSMPLTILNIGNREDEALYRRATTTPGENPSIRTFADLAQARTWASQHQPDIAVVDLRKFNGEGVSFLRRFRGSPACSDIPLLAIVPEHDRANRGRALAAGANDLLLTPLDLHECQMRVANLLTLSAQRRIIRRQAQWLEKSNSDVSSEIRAREQETLLRLARAGEYRDEGTGMHVMRMAQVSRSIAETLGLPDAECEVIEAAAPMHDIGKIGISDSILRKQGPLTTAERRVMETHTIIGYEILKDSRSVYVQRGAEIALTHHERFDGTGYPHCLRAETIPLAARIVAVADVYDALTSNRPYKPAWPENSVRAYLVEQSGKHFDPACVDAFLARPQSAAGF